MALSAHQHGCFATEQAIACGMTKRQIELRVASGRWAYVLPRVLGIAGVPISWEGRVMAACLRAAPGAAAACSTAAGLWGLLNERKEPIEVATTRNIRDLDPQAPERATFRFHRVGRLPADQIAIIDSIPVTSAERTLLDVAGTRAPWVFNEALDCGLRRSLTSLDQLRDFLERERRSGVDGVLRLRAALEVRSPEVGVTRSGLERELLSLLQHAGLPLPELNQEVRGPDGFCALVDMLYREPKLVIEIQSYAHHSSLEAFNRDAERLGSLTALGYRPIEVTADQIRRHPHRTIERVSTLLHSFSRSQSHATRG
jgi:Protein of unknown function (DUF559)